MKLNIILIFSTIFLLCKLNAYTGTYYEYYENLSNEPVSALSASTGQNIFDNLPVDIDNLDTRSKLFISSSLYVLQGGDNYGPNNEITRMENVDFAKNFSIIYNYKPAMMPFVSFYTPYKQVLDYGLTREITKKRDVLSLGWISDLGKHQLISSVDYVISSFIDGIDYERYSNAFSARFLINIKVNERSSMFFGAVSESFLQFDTDKEVERKNKYFNGYEGNLGLNYKSRSWFCIYSAMYCTYDVFYDETDGSQLNYPWVLENKIIFGKHLNENLTTSISYELLPSTFTSYMPDIGDKFRHTIGVFVGFKMENIDMNFSYHDSKILSEESLGKSAFQMDMVYKLRK
ncbi:MAG: hypothetical protein JXR69_08665 [Candidatus Delongbacteria bacterium]|nr:hypothetical protein [Candidatus Delongbacteria bacterium]